MNEQELMQCLPETARQALEEWNAQENETTYFTRTIIEACEQEVITQEQLLVLDSIHQQMRQDRWNDSSNNNPIGTDSSE